MNIFSEEDQKMLREFGFIINLNTAKRIRQPVIEIITRENTFLAEVNVKRFRVVKSFPTMKEALSNLDNLKEQIRNELKELLQQL